MEEKKKLRSKLIKLIIYNIIAFSIILLIFGAFVYAMVSSITYSSVDKELRENMKILTEVDKQTINFFTLYEDVAEDRNKFLKQDIIGYQDYVITQKIKNPKVIIILRDNDENIINLEELGRLTDYLDDLNSSPKFLYNKIYNIEIAGMYKYRGINFKLDYDDTNDGRNVQLLINIDSESDLINNYRDIIYSAVAVGIILSIIASFILSKHNLKPLEENMIKQLEFVQNASHELRTPLTIIQAKQELLLQEPNAKIIDKTEDIVLTLNETKRLTKLVKDLMTISRADNNSIKLQKENINLDDFIKDLVKPYNEMAEMQEKQIKLDLKYETDIKLDTNRIYQLMIILLDNAIKYTEQGDSIEISTYLKENKCVIEIKDTGIGISDEGLKRVFERFYREDAARNRETGGSGLGLSIASLIVAAHGGTIKASHNTPKGTIITIRLPR